MVVRKPIGQSLLDADLITEEQLKEALHYQRKVPEKEPLGEITVKLGFLKDEDFASFLASYLNFPFLNLDGFNRISPEAISLVPASLAKRHNVFPIRKEETALHVAMSDPLDFTAADSLSKVTKCRIVIIVCSKNQIKRYITDYYETELQQKSSLDSIETTAKPELDAAWGKKGEKNLAFAVSFINLLLERAYRDNAKAVHIQPGEAHLKIFFRIGQGLEQIGAYSKSILTSVTSRIKYLSVLDSSCRNVLQDGRFKIKLAACQDAIVNVEVSILPTVWGERIVLALPH